MHGPQMAPEHILTWFGFEDTVVNHILLMQDIADREEGPYDTSLHNKKHQTKEKMLSMRAFSVQCIYNMECLSLPMDDID